MALACSFALAGIPWILVGVGCGGNEGGGARGGAPQTKNAATKQARLVQVSTPRASPHPINLTLQAQLEAFETVQVPARVDGPVHAVRAELGDRVREGQALAQIATDDARARLGEVLANLAQAESDLARLESLAASENATRQAIEQARTKVRVAQAQRGVLSRELRDGTVRAPFDGAIARRYISEGAYVHVGGALFDLVKVDELRLVLQVPARYSSAVDVGDVVRVQLPEGSTTTGETAEPNTPGSAVVEATIARISPAIAADTRTFRVEADVASPGQRLRAGMFVTTVLEVGAAPAAVRVPRGAVFNVLGNDRVMRVVQGKVDPVDVQIIAEEEGDAIVLGITTEDVIVVRGPSLLAPGSTVRVERVAEEPRAGRAPPAGAVDPG